jgi:hypothetical protein
MKKGIIDRVVGAGKMAYWEFTDPTTEEDIARDEAELQSLRDQLSTLQDAYERVVDALDNLEMDYDRCADERDAWKRRYEDLLANVMTPLQEDEHLLLPADKLKPTGINKVHCPSVWIEPTEKVTTQITTTGSYPDPIILSGKSDLSKLLKPTKKKAAKKPAKKSVKKAGK